MGLKKSSVKDIVTHTFCLAETVAVADPQDLSRKWAVGIASAAAVELSAAVGSRLVALAGSRPAAACSLAAVLPSAEGELAGPLQRKQADKLSNPRG